MYFEPGDTIFDVQNKIDEYINENRKIESSNGTDKIISALLSIPGLLTVGVGLFKLLDRYGLLPRAIIDVSPFHESLLITNLASIRTNHIYHHTYGFGTTSLAMAMGNLREVPKRRSGEIYLERCIPVGLVMDERIATGVYFAQAFRKFKEYLSDPTKLEKPAENIVLDFEDQYDKQRIRREKIALKKEKKAQKNK